LILPRLDRDQLAGRNFDLAAKNFNRFAGHENMIGTLAALAPLDFEIAAAQLDDRFVVSASGQHSRDQRRASAGAAGERLARAAFPDAHFQMSARNRQDEFGVDAARKERMVLELPAEPRKLGVVEAQHAVVVDEDLFFFPRSSSELLSTPLPCAPSPIWAVVPIFATTSARVKARRQDAYMRLAITGESRLGHG